MQLATGRTLQDALRTPPTMQDAYARPKWRTSKRVYYKGRQWAITSYGLENIRGPYHYFVDHKQLFAKSKGDLLRWEHPSWLSHIAAKAWVDVHDLYRALQYAQENRREFGV